MSPAPATTERDAAAFGAVPFGMDPASAGELDDELLAAFTALDAGFAALMEIGQRGDLQALGPDRLIGVLHRFEAHRCRLAAVDTWLVEAARTENLPAHVAARSLPAALAAILRISPATAAARVRVAEQLTPQHHPSTDHTTTPLPVLASAIERGALTSDQVTVISRSLRRLTTNPAVCTEDTAMAEETLVRHATAFGPHDLKLIADRIDDALLPDGTEPSDMLSTARRGITISGVRADGTHAITGNLTRELAARLHAVLDPLAAPHPTTNNPDATAADGSGTSSDSGSDTASDGSGPVGGRDPRSAPQRTHDALNDAMARLLDSPGLPRSGGTPATVHLIINADDLLEEIDTHTGNATTWHHDHTHPTPTNARAGAGAGAGADCGEGPSGGASGESTTQLREWEWLTATRTRAAASNQRVIGHTSHGIPITLIDLTRLATDALVIPVWMSATQGVLAYGRTQRICPENLTHALIARDRGCSFPGCTAPPQWCERHHIIEWVLGGHTNLDQLTLVCRYHHDHFAERGWHVTIHNGYPVWIPPRWLDPDQTPLMNLRITAGTPPRLNTHTIHAKAAADEERRHTWRAHNRPASGQMSGRGS